MTRRGAEHGLLPAAALAITTTLAGCAPPVIIASAGVSALQAGTEAFINGELEAAQLAPIGTVYAAALAALADMGFPIGHETLNARSATIEARQLDGRAIEVRLTARSSQVTKITIRIGMLGDQAVSRLILGQLQARCPTPPQPDPATPVPR